MIRYMIFVLAALALAVPAFAEWNYISGGSPSSVVSSVARGQCVYERHTQNSVQGALLQVPVWPTMVKLNANVAGTDEGDVQIEVRRCPHGTLTYSGNVCHKTAYKKADGTVIETIDGDTDDGTDAIYGIRSSVLVMNVTTHPAGGRVAEIEVCVDQ